MKNAQDKDPFVVCKSALEILLAEAAGKQNGQPNYEPLLIGLMRAETLLALGGSVSAVCRSEQEAELTTRAMELLTEDKHLAHPTDAESFRELLEGLSQLAPINGCLTPDTARRKATGSYYTPRFIVEYIVSEALRPALEEASLRTTELRSHGASGRALLDPYLSICVLDAAIGSGRFLAAAARSIAHAMAADQHIRADDDLDSITPQELFRIAVERCVFGVDTSATAIESAALTMCFEAAIDAYPMVSRNLRQANALEPALPQCRSEDTSGQRRLPYVDNCEQDSWQNLFPKVFAREAPGFDAVVGNPPWVSFSGRQSVKPGKESAANLYTHSRGAHGWPSLHGAFLRIAAAVCKTGGRIGQIVPEQFLDLPGYSHARVSLLSNTRLIGEPLSVGERVFPGVVGPACVLILEKVEKNTRETHRPLATPLRAGGILSPEGIIAHRSEPDAIASAIVEKLMGFPTAPSSCFKDCGVHTGNCARSLIVDSPRPGAVPVRVGRDIIPYSTQEPARWLVVAPTVAGDGYFRIGAAAHYLTARIVLRQTAARPIAARHTNPGYFRNSILACYGFDSASIDYLLALLNSRLVAFFHQNQFRDGRQKAFPQVKIYHLRAIPIPTPVRLPSDAWPGEDTARRLQKLSRTAEDEVDLIRALNDFLSTQNEDIRHHRITSALELLVPRLEEMVGNEQGVGLDLRVARSKEIRGLARAIDYLVYLLYGLSEVEIERVETFYARN